MTYLDTPDFLNTPGFVFGIDVSKWNPVNWATIPGIVKFAFIKASQRDFKDSLLMQHYEGAIAAGIPVGFYHYLDPKMDAHQQAETFLRATEDLVAHPLLGHMLDYEEREISGEAALGFMSVLEGAGVPCGVYTAPRIMRHVSSATAAKLGRYPLWAVDYYKTMPRPEHKCELPKGWDDWRFWQWGSHNPLAEMRAWYNKDLDCNYYRGSVEDLADGATLPSQPDGPGADAPPRVNIPEALDYNRRQAYSREAQAHIVLELGAQIFDEAATVEAVARYQQAHGLTVDGKLGPQTAAAIGLTT